MATLKITKTIHKTKYRKSKAKNKRCPKCGRYMKK